MYLTIFFPLQKKSENKLKKINVQLIQHSNNR